MSMQLNNGPSISDIPSFNEGADDPNAPLEWEEQNKNPDSLNQKESLDPQLTPEEIFSQKLDSLSTQGIIILNTVEGFSNEDKKAIYTAIEADKSELSDPNATECHGDKTYKALAGMMRKNGIDNPQDYIWNAPAFYNGTLGTGEEVGVDKQEVEADKRNEIADQLERLIPMIPKIIETIDRKKEQDALAGFPNGFMDGPVSSPYSAEAEAEIINNTGNI